MHGRDDLSPLELAHAERLRAVIVQDIEACGGWISFERYMDLALYAPGLGYYSAGARKMGAGGDFTTAPEISRLFGACIARQCAEIMAETVQGAVLELGAGSGRLALDILTRMEALGCLPDRYLVLEVSADLRARQRALISEHAPHLLSRIEWLDAPPEGPFDGVILANEVLDALPVARFRWTRAACEELGVAAATAGFEWCAQPAGDVLTAACAARAVVAGGWPDGYVSEYCPRLGAWTSSVARGLRRGAVLWFDYGLPRAQYYLAERQDGTLICHFRQRAYDDPFQYPGLQDISAWVDFTAVAEACMDSGFELAGFTTQAHFLAGLRIDEEMRTLARGNDARFARLASQAKDLLLPGAMGERFKAMAWTRDLRRELSGFGLRDLRHSL
jgi:SAM-dependent MidA family methyltransferase